jgi:RHS repeat-associated protein
MGAWSFQYDTLNRLMTGNATWPDNTPQYACWNYDSFGNRQQQEISSAAFESGSGGANACSAQSSAYLATDIASYYSNNRIASTNARGVSWTPGYDASGNMTSDGANQYLYDAEGRICAVYTNSIFSPTMTGYLYDADGTRVAKGTITAWNCDPTTNGFQFTENYVLGPGGEELSMFDGSNNWQRTNAYAGGKLIGTYDMVSNPLYTYGGSQPVQVPALHFHLEDPLGTRRMQLSGNLPGNSYTLAALGQPETDIQSLPYGDQLNSFPDYYAPSTADDSTPLHFTGKERDAESGNDYFEARYYSSAMGRFMSPDWSAQEEPVPYAKLDDPQTLNLYSYVLNNPLGSVDPDGHCGGPGEEACGDHTVEEVSAAVYHEVGVPDASGGILDETYTDLAHAIYNGSGKDNISFAPTSTDGIDTSSAGYQLVLKDTEKACKDAKNGIDPTNGADLFNNRYGTQPDRSDRKFFNAKKKLTGTAPVIKLDGPMTRQVGKGKNRRTQTFWETFERQKDGKPVTKPKPPRPPHKPKKHNGGN